MYIHLKSEKPNWLIGKIVDFVGRYVERKSPYSTFCEISGCKFEYHANTEYGLREGLRNHMDKDHA